jgi:hypothetical protein
LLAVAQREKNPCGHENVKFVFKQTGILFSQIALFDPGSKCCAFKNAFLSLNDALLSLSFSLLTGCSPGINPKSFTSKVKQVGFSISFPSSSSYLLQPINPTSQLGR